MKGLVPAICCVRSSNTSRTRSEIMEVSMEVGTGLDLSRCVSVRSAGTENNSKETG